MKDKSTAVGEIVFGIILIGLALALYTIRLGQYRILWYGAFIAGGISILTGLISLVRERGAVPSPRQRAGPWQPPYEAQLPPTERAAPPPPSAPSPTPRIEPTRRVEERAPAMAWLVIKSGPRPGQQFGLTRGRNTIGRDGTRCDIVLDDRAVSAEHARINFENGQFVIYDLASLNGTFVNRQRVQRQLLMDGDLVRLGNTTLVFKKV